MYYSISETTKGKIDTTILGLRKLGIRVTKVSKYRLKLEKDNLVYHYSPIKQYIYDKDRKHIATGLHRLLSLYNIRLNQNANNCTT